MKTDYTKYFLIIWILIIATVTIVTVNAVAAPSNGYTMEVGGIVDGSMTIREQNTVHSMGNITSYRTSTMNVMATRGTTQFMRNIEGTSSGYESSTAISFIEPNFGGRASGDENAYAFMSLIGETPYCESVITDFGFDMQGGVIMTELNNMQTITTSVNSNIRHTIAIDGQGIANYQSNIMTMTGIMENETPNMLSTIDQSFNSRFNGDINMGMNFQFNSRIGIPQGLPADMNPCLFV